jgi:hypothetical protein
MTPASFLTIWYVSRSVFPLLLTPAASLPGPISYSENTALLAQEMDGYVPEDPDIHGGGSRFFRYVSYSQNL